MPIVVVPVVAALLLPASAQAGCPASIGARAIQTSDVIVIGTPESLDSNIFAFEVERYFKGSGPAVISVFEANGPLGALPTRSSLGQRLLLFLYEGNLTEAGEMLYASNPCRGGPLPEGDRGMEVSFFADVVAETGPGQPPDDVAPQPESIPTTTESGGFPREAMWLAAAILPLAFLAAATLAPWRRR